MSVAVEVPPEPEWGVAVGALLAARLTERPDLRLCLPTGHTPVPAYRAFADLGGNLDQATVFLLDEFGLPDGHPARCDEMLARTLLDLGVPPPAGLHSIDVGADDVAKACTQYDTLVADGGLDLTLLGLGANGHLGLNEPGTKRDSPTRVIELDDVTIRGAARYGTGIAPQWGVTLGMQPMLESREIWLLVTGAHKATILQRALTGPVGPDVPASYLQEHPNTTVLADHAAAAQLGSEG